VAIRGSVRRTQTFAAATFFRHHPLGVRRFALLLLVAACGELPVTSAPLPPAGARGGAGGSGAMQAGTGGMAGAPGTGGNLDNSGTSSGGSQAIGANSPGGGGGKAGAGTAGKTGDGGRAGSGGAGGEPELGESGVGAAPTGGSAGNSAGAFSTNRDEFFGDPRCSAGFDLCEDFESGAFDSAIWEPSGTEHPSVDATRAARGEYSAHFHTTNNGLSMIRTRAIFPATDNTYFGRMFVYFDSMPTAPENAHWSVSGAQGPDAEEFEVRVGGKYDGSINRFAVGSDHGPTGDWTTEDEDPGDAVPVREWVCLEWMHKGDTHETRFFWEGVEHPSLYTSATEHGGEEGEDYELPEFASVWFGWWLYQSETVPAEFDVWIDEIALDAERVGCDK
jgi:hypothetical protein